MVIGILGVGHLSAAILAGLARSKTFNETVLLSPRGRAREMSELYGHEICADAAELVRRADVVLLAVRPHDAAKAIEGLPWRSSQLLISVCAGVALAGFASVSARVVRAMPLTAVEINASPTVFYPEVNEARLIIEHLGPAIALENEAAFEIATVNAAIYGWAQQLIRQSADWASGKGADPSTMRLLVSRTFEAAGRLIAESDTPMETLLHELATPGGITELGLNVLSDGGQPDAWHQACEAVLARLNGRR